MYIKCFLLSALVVACCFCSLSARAHLVSPPLYLTEIIDQSQVIVVAQVVSFTEDQQSLSNIAPLENQSNILASDDYTVASAMYTFEALTEIKGHSNTKLQLHLPPLLRINYGFANPKIKVGDYVLLFLTKRQSNTLIPVEPSVPLIQLGQTLIPASKKADVDVTTNVLRLMLSSLSDPHIRQANTALLRDVNNPIMPAGLSPFIDDLNDKVKDNVLYCLAVNQVVSAIPRILELQLKQAKQGSGTYCVTALGFYTNSKAASALNPLLFSKDEYVRVNSIMALQKIASAGSIPYLVLALHDPDPQNLVPYTAYLTLRKIVPNLSKFANDFDYTQPIPGKNLIPINAWWNDELMGVHFHKQDQVVVRNADQTTDEVGMLNLETFAPNLSERLKSVKRLTSKANKTSIPFLVLALQDPDTDAAYLAYKTLHRLIPTLGATKSAAVFNAKRTAISQPVYYWWRDELLGKHLPQ